MKTVARLITTFIPDLYNISLDLQREKRTFRGTVTIFGEKTTDQPVRLHSKDLNIQSVTVNGKEATWEHQPNDELVITSRDETPGDQLIVIGYEGVITDAMHGLYPCYYNHDGERKELLATQFESHHAREVFPCVDEPEAKAEFDLTLTTEQGVTVLGNQPVDSQSTEGDRLVTTFQRTPRMSTYLLAWVTGELHKKTATTKNGVEVNVWATPAQPAESLDFALDIATRTIDFFDEYFDTPYPLVKSDHVALPDFSSGAMENWGLITYRETTLLADPATTSVSSKHYIATVIAHELSHQWFGNLVTMKWWNNLWLNESFATLMEYVAIDALHPEWNIWLDFSTLESVMALRRDAMDGVQSVQMEVHHPDEISTLFDGAIVYAKGARLLRMLQNYVGHDAFREGLKNYFALHAYRNTEGDDLWHELSLSSGKDIATFMNTWISQPGYPVVSIEQDEGNITLSQEQFFIGNHADSEKTWPIPLNGSDPATPVLLDKQQTSFVANNEDNPLRLNVGDTAHFITRYDHTTLADLTDNLIEYLPEPLDRAQLLNEQTLLARAGLISSSELIPLLEAYRFENTEAVWDIMSMTIGELKKFTEQDASSEAKLRELAGVIARPQYERLGWHPATSEPETDTKLRSTILSLMLYSESKEVVDEALNLYSSTALDTLNPELRPLILSAAVRHGEETVFDTLLEAHKQTASAELQQDIAAALTSSKNSDRLMQILQLIKDETVIRPQDAARWYVWTLRNREGRSLAWRWLKDNWGWVESTFGGDKSYDDFPRYTATGLVSRNELDDYTSFFHQMKGVPALSRVIHLGITEISARVELIERDGDAVRNTLASL